MDLRNNNSEISLEDLSEGQVEQLLRMMYAEEEEEESEESSNNNNTFFNVVNKFK